MRPRILFLALVLSFLSVVASTLLTVATRADGLLFDPPPLAQTPADPPSEQTVPRKLAPPGIAPAELTPVKVAPAVDTQSDVVVSRSRRPIERQPGFSTITDSQTDRHEAPVEVQEADPVPTGSPEAFRVAEGPGHSMATDVADHRSATSIVLADDPAYTNRTEQSPPVEQSRQSVPWTLPQPRITQMMGIRLGGWIDQGISTVANMPADRYNGLVTFNDRDGEYQLNQVWLYLQRDANNDGYGLDVGGRIDFLYGTDARFAQSVDGLEADWDQREPFYQAALPQFYVDVAYNDWIVRAGRFFTILGYESVAAPENFFYSHAYALQYGEPLTHFGLLATRRLGQMELSAGFHRGNDQFDDTDGLDALNLLGGISYTTGDEKMTAAFAFSATEEGPNVANYVQSLVATFRLTNRLSYVIQGDYGETRNEVSHTRGVWTGLNQYMFYTINDCWSAGIRSEWFRDRDGSRVSGFGIGNRNTGPYSGDFFEITLGLNWSPLANLTVRPEARWDIFDPIGTPGSLGAYDAGDRNTQFLFGCDVVSTF